MISKGCSRNKIFTARPLDALFSVAFSKEARSSHNFCSDDEGLGLDGIFSAHLAITTYVAFFMIGGTFSNYLVVCSLLWMHMMNYAAGFVRHTRIYCDGRDCKQLSRFGQTLFATCYLTGI